MAKAAEARPGAPGLLGAGSETCRLSETATELTTGAHFWFIGPFPACHPARAAKPGFAPDLAVVYRNYVIAPKT
jgi:hypothetical protein